MIYGFLYIGSCVISLILSTVLYKMRRSDIGKRLSLLSGLVSFWLLMEGLSFFVSDIQTVLLFQKLKYVSVVFVPPALFMAVIQFVHKTEKFSLPLKIVFFVIPVLSLLSVISGNFPYLFASNAQIYFQMGIPIYSYDKEIGFIVNAGYSYGIILYTCFLLFACAIHSPKIYRLQSLFVFAGCSVTIFLNILFVTGIFGVIVIDTTPISILITLLIFYWGVYALPVSRVIPYARNLVIENMSDMVFVVDNSEDIIDVNPKAREFILHNSTLYKDNEKSDASFTGTSLSQLVNSIPNLNDFDSQAGQDRERTISVSTEDGIWYYRIKKEPIYDIRHVKIGQLYMLINITQMQEFMNRLINLNDQMMISDKIISDALEGIIITDANNSIVRVNTSMERMSGYTSLELIGQSPRIFKSERHDLRFYQEMWAGIVENGFWEGEIWDKKKNGNLYPKWMSITTIYDVDCNITHYIGISSDVTKMKKAENDIQMLAYYDSLTGAPNRMLFYDRLQTALVRTVRSKKGVALFYINLDHFKMVNDALGHVAGDELLIEVTRRIKNKIRAVDTLSRLGGDEFTLILEDINTPDDAEHVAQLILTEILKPFFIMGKEVATTLSIGIALAPYEEMTVEGMIRKATMAMDHAKKTGGSKFVFSSEEIDRKNHELYEMHIQLNNALKNDEFVLYLQPQILKMGNGYKIIGAEALIRWQPKEGEMISPAKFIPIAEGNGLIIPIGNWVIEEVFRMDRILKARNIRLKLALNVSIKQFEQDGLLELFKFLLDQNQDLDISLSVEITESYFINEIDQAIERLNAIKALGIGIALDDFGTGFSAMSYLTKLPIDYLKIDQSFIADIGSYDHKNLAFMIIAMAKSLELMTIAEGVETEYQLERLNDAGCDIIQGYYFSKPLNLEDFIVFCTDFDQSQQIRNKEFMMPLRRAQIGEEVQLSELAYRSEAYWGYDEVFMDAFKKRYSVKREHIDTNLTYIYEEAGELVGFFTLTFSDLANELEFFYIDPAFIRQGYGEKMWSQLIDLCHTAGILEFDLVTSPQASAFYEKMGAVVVGEVESYLRQGRKIPKLQFHVK